MITYAPNYTTSNSIKTTGLIRGEMGTQKNREQIKKNERIFKKPI